MAGRRKSISLGGVAHDRVTRGHADATPERLDKARRHGTATVDAAGVRRLADPFDLLHARNLLDRDNAESNALLWQAGDRLRHHWHRSRLDPLTAFDFSREHVDGTSGQSTTPTETAMRHRDAMRAATDAVGARLMPYLTGLVLDNRSVADLRPLIRDTGHARTADALIVERLREALHRLCDLWDLKPNPRPRRIGGWRATADGIAG